MRIKSVIFIMLLILFTIPTVSCTKTKPDGQISAKDVSSIELLLDKDNKVVYLANKNNKEIEEFIKALNEGNPFGNIMKTTPDTRVTITFKNGIVRETIQ